MKLLKFFLILSSFLWGVFSVLVLAYLRQWIGFEKLVLFMLFLIAILIEELFYLIKEGVIDARKV